MLTDRASSFVTPLLLAGAVGLLLPSDGSAQTATPEDWVGCWMLDHEEDWGPAIDQPGFPTGTAAPAPRRVLLDRIPAQRGSLEAAPGAATYRAEWQDAGIRTREAWAIRPDDHVLVESVSGPEIQSLLMEGPPVASDLPGRWFLRRTDTPFPEVRSLIVPRRFPCEPGEGPHTVSTDEELGEIFQRRELQGTFTLYDRAERRIIRPQSGPSGGPTMDGGGALSADDQMIWLVDHLNDRRVRPGPVPDGIDPSTVLDQAILTDVDGIEARGSIAVALAESAEHHVGWLVGHFTAGDVDHVLALNAEGIPESDTGFLILQEIATDLLERLGVIPEAVSSH